MKETTSTPEWVKKPLEERTERELELTRIVLQREANKRLKGIHNNVQFFFWLFVLSLLISLLVYISIESS